MSRGGHTNMPMPSQGHSFSQVPNATIPRSVFDRSHGHKTTFDAGFLVPFYVDEALPGDTFNLRTSGFARMSTPIFPVMDNLYLETFYFFVPNRLLWRNWEKMMGAQDNPNDSTDYLVPQIFLDGAEYPSGYPTGTMADHMGIPVGAKGVNMGHNALHVRAYNLIWDEWFRDQNLQNSVAIDDPDFDDDGPDSPLTATFLLRRGKRHDYFTSALPWPQKGPAVELPLGTDAPVIGIGTTDQNFPDVGTTIYTPGGGQTYWPTGKIVGGDNSGVFLKEDNNNNPGYPRVHVDLENVQAATVNQLRQAFQVQKMYERDARGGTRYTEMIRAHFGVTSPDARLQRPEYLGGGSSRVNIHPIYSTSDTATDVQTGSELGQLSAVGTAAFSGHGFTKSFTEHGVLIGLVNVRADLSYQQGLNRMWSRRDRLDFYFPALAHLGEQEVLNKEIYFDDGDGQNNQVFGYQERFAEYRYKPNCITGAFRSDAAQPLDAWHLAQDFDTRPQLDPVFIQDTPPVDRVIATVDEPHFIADFWHSLRCARPMPMFGTPGNIDRF